MKDRIQKILTSESLTSARFADIIGVQRSSISHILSGRNKPSLDFLNKILTQFPNISGDWLITGNGSMRKNSTPPSFNANKTLFANENQNRITQPETTPKNEQKTIKSDENTALGVKQSSESITSPISKEKKDIERIVIFYTDHSFTEYTPDSL